MSNSYMSTIRNCDRKIIDFGNGKTGRVYFDEEGRTYASVTTVLGMRDDPGKENALKFWRKKYDGKDGNPYHKHINEYSKWRGTLIHWYLQSVLDPDLPISNDEEEAIEKVEAEDDNYHFVRSIALNHIQWDKSNFPSMVDWLHNRNHDNRKDPMTITDLLWQDMSWAYSQFASLLPELGLTQNSFIDSHYKTLDTHFRMSVRNSCVIEVEKYLMNHEDRYGGQCDLLYETYDGTTVLADIKTSRAIRWSNKRQLAAYARAIEVDPEIDCDSVDECVIIRLSPDELETELSYESQWKQSRDELYAEFDELNQRVQEHVSDLDTSDLSVSGQSDTTKKANV